MCPGLVTSLVTALFALSCGVLPVQARVAAGRKGSLRGELAADSFSGEVRDAISETLGCGGGVDEARLAHIEAALLPMWRASPKSSAGRVERSTLRYLAHRYFMRRSSLWVRGLEYLGSLNSSEWQSADDLSRRVPDYVESMLATRHAVEHGFDLRDAALMVATLERLVFDAESHLLEQVYRRRGIPARARVARNRLVAILEEYMLRWILAAGVSETNIGKLLNNPRSITKAFPQWPSITKMAAGELSALDFRRKQLSRGYSFQDAHEVVGSITENFASFWQSECATMKDQLVAMDIHSTGRVPLSKFYGTGLDADWRFRESEEYLRDLGALDDTSGRRGKQVIVANYIQAASNCIISSPHYLVCCTNECESLMGEVEAGIGQPTGSPADILLLVGNLTSQETLDGEVVPPVTASLWRQLEEIASAHGGVVPLHGRLFAQWMHYAFPRECPFPHRHGSVFARTPREFGTGYTAAREDMEGHANTQYTGADAQDALVDREELQWMSQWSSEEELPADYALHLRAPWERCGIAAPLLGAAALALLVLGGAIGLAEPSKADSLLPSHQKKHFI